MVALEDDGTEGEVEIDEERFEQLVADALDTIPEALGRDMENVAITVADWPSSEQLADRQGRLLGL